MRIIDVLVFKSPKRIDWKATEAVVSKHLKSINPNASAVELTMNHVSTMKEIRKFVRKAGVINLHMAAYGRATKS